MGARARAARAGAALRAAREHRHDRAQRAAAAGGDGGSAAAIVADAAAVATADVVALMGCRAADRVAAETEAEVIELEGKEEVGPLLVVVVKTPHRHATRHL